MRGTNSDSTVRNIILLILLIALSLGLLVYTADSFFTDPIATLVAIGYLVIYFRMVFRLSSEPDYEPLTNSEPEQGFATKIKKKISSPYFLLVHLLSNYLPISALYKQRFQSISIASVIDWCFRFIIVTIFMIGTFLYLIRQALIQLPDSTFQIILLMIVFLSFSYRTSEKVLTILPILKRPLRDARIQAEYSSSR